VLGVLAMLSLSGCVRVRAAMAVSPDDLVSGQIVIAALPTRAGDAGPELEIPEGVKARVSTEKYDLDGYIGNTLSFHDLNFEEVRELSSSVNPNSQHFQMSFRRSGDLVTMSGSVDLTGLPTDKADVQIKLAFPGRVTKTDGIDEDGAITWKPKAGEVTEFSATAEYSTKGQSSWSRWVMIVAASAIGVALLVALLAFAARRVSLRQAQ
jgi:phosphatidylinositol mannoside-binding LppM-like protein